MQNRTLEQIVDEPVPPVMEAAVEVMRATPQECVLNRTPEQLVDEPVPQIAEEIVERPVSRRELLKAGAPSCTTNRSSVVVPQIQSIDSSMDL